MTYIDPENIPSQTRLEEYISTIERLEPNIVAIDASTFYASAAISLKRIADVLEAREKRAVEYWNNRDKAVEF